MEDSNPADGDESQLVTRRFPVPGLGGAEDADMIEEELETLPGVMSAASDIGQGRVTVSYRVTECDYHTVSSKLREIGYPVADSWWVRLKSAWYQNIDLNDRDNAKAATGACCNRPPPRMKR